MELKRVSFEALALLRSSQILVNRFVKNMLEPNCWLTVLCIGTQQASKGPTPVLDFNVWDKSYVEA